MVYTERAPRRQQLHYRCKYATWMDIGKRAIMTQSKPEELSSCVKVEVAVPNSPYGLCGGICSTEQTIRTTCDKSAVSLLKSGE